MLNSLTVVIPAYNERKRIEKSILPSIHYLDKRKVDYEIILVDDGSTDGTANFVRSFGFPKVIVHSLPENQGKGAAVKKGFQLASKEFVLFMDADYSTSIEEIEKFESQFNSADVWIGSRGMIQSDIQLHQPLYRETMGKIFNKLVWLFALDGIRDTQCGFKLFRKNVVDKIIPLQKIPGFCFDVELLYLARKFEFRIVEIPIQWFNDEDTRVHAFTSSMRMFLDLTKIGWLHRND